MNNRWHRYCVSKGFSVTSVIFFPSSAINSDASAFQGPAVSIAIGMKWCVVARLLYLAILLVTTLFAAGSAFPAVSPMWDAAYVSGTVTSHARGFPHLKGMRDAPSGLFPSDRERPIGSLESGGESSNSSHQIWSLNSERLMCLGSLFRHDSPWSPLASTITPQMHTCGGHVMQPSLNPTATRIASTDKRRPIAVSGGAFSQSPVYGASAAFNLTYLVGWRVTTSL